jgi:putative FmdB family regulatory protein
MPIYEYNCKACGHTFDALVRGNTRVRCKECGSEKLEKLFSLPTVHSETTHGLAMKAAKRRDAAQGKDRMHEQLKYEESHDRHG